MLLSFEAKHMCPRKLRRSRGATIPGRSGFLSYAGHSHAGMSFSDHQKSVMFALVEDDFSEGDENEVDLTMLATDFD
jgi:hypothetical protein